MGLLVLSRHRDEVIRIGDDIRVVIVDIRGDKVRVGVEAPRHTAVHRNEVYEAIQRQQEEANLATDAPVPFLYGVVLQNSTNTFERRVTIVESPSSDEALNTAAKRFNSVAYPARLATVQCFGEASEDSRDQAARWLFAKWIDRHEPFRVA